MTTTRSRPYELPDAVNTMPCTVRIEARASRFHEPARGAKRLCAEDRSCRIDIERREATLEVYTELAAHVSWLEAVDVDEWQVIAAELGQHEHFDTPYFLYKLTDVIERTLVADASLTTGHLFPPRVYRPEGPWQRLRGNYLHDYMSRAQIEIPDIGAQSFRNRMATFIDALWFLTVESVYVSLHGDGHLPKKTLHRRENTAQLRLAYSTSR